MRNTLYVRHGHAFRRHRVFDNTRQSADSWCFKNRRNGQLDPEQFRYPGNYLYSLQRLAADIEEIVGSSDLIGTQNFGPDTRHYFLDRTQSLYALRYRSLLRSR